jgi:hypothetical protein
MFWCATHAAAQPVASGTGVTQVFYQQQGDGSWNVDIYVTTGASTTLTIVGATGQEIELNRVRIDSIVPNNVVLVVDSTLTKRITGLREAFLFDIDGSGSLSGSFQLGTINIDKTTSGTKGYLGVSSGSFVTDRISVIQVEGDILSSLTSSGASVVNNISCGGSLLGDVSIGGNCNGILVGWQQGGGTSNIGASGVGNDVSIDVAGNLVSLTGDNIYADIDVGGNLQFFQVEGSWDAFGGTGTPDGDGEFIGSLVCDTMSGGSAEVLFRIYGDLSADVTVEDELASGRRMGIGGDLVSTGSITFTQSDGLKGNITIGYLPASDADWDGDITLGTTTLSPTPFYTQVPTAGQVGRAPHGLHREACDPAYAPGYPVEPADPTGQTISLTHYGEIRLAPSTGIPYRVLEASGPHCDGTCIHGLLTDVTAGDPGPPVRDPWTLVGVVSGRTATIKGPTYAGKHYHIVLNTDNPGNPVQHLETNDLFMTQRDLASYVYIIGTQ